MYFNSLCSKFDGSNIDCFPVYEHWQTSLHEVTGNRPCFSPQRIYRYSNLCSLFPQDSEFYAATVDFESSPVFSKIWRDDFSNTAVVYLQPIAGELHQTLPSSKCVAFYYRVSN